MHTMKNKVQLIGNLGQDPEIKTTEKGKKLARFSVATNEVYRTPSGDKVEETQWHNLIAWGKMADIAEKLLRKGKEIAVEGKLIHRKYLDKEGKNRTITEVQVNDLLLIGNKEKSHRIPTESGS